MYNLVSQLTNRDKKQGNSMDIRPIDHRNELAPTNRAAIQRLQHDTLLKIITEYLRPVEVLTLLTARTFVPIVRNLFLKLCSKQVPPPLCYFRDRIQRHFPPGCPRHDAAMYRLAAMQLTGHLPFKANVLVPHLPVGGHVFTLRDGGFASHGLTELTTTIYGSNNELVGFFENQPFRIDFIDCLPNGRHVVGNSVKVRVYSDDRTVENTFGMPDDYLGMVFTSAVALSNGNVVIGGGYEINLPGILLVGKTDGTLAEYFKLSGSVTAIVALPEDSIAVGDQGGSVIILDANAKVSVRHDRQLLRGVNRNVSCMTVMPNRWIAVGYGDGKVRCFDLNGARFKLTEQEGRVTCMTVLSGHFLATAGRSSGHNTVHIFGTDHRLMTVIKRDYYMDIKAIRALPEGIVTDYSDGMNTLWLPHVVKITRTPGKRSLVVGDALLQADSPPIPQSPIARRQHTRCPRGISPAVLVGIVAIFSGIIAQYVRYSR